MVLKGFQTLQYMRNATQVQRFFIGLLFVLLGQLPVIAQDQYRIAAIGFYNLENLFDL